MASYNSVTLMGNICRDIDLKYTGSGMALAKFSLAINETYQKDGKKCEEVCFIDCTAWGKQAETMAQYLTKGSPILIDGKLKQNKWETKEGDKRSKIEVTVRRFTFLPKGEKSQGGYQAGKKLPGPPASADDVESGIPF